MFEDSVSEVVKLDAVAVVVSVNLLNLLVLRLKTTSLKINFSILFIALNLFLSFGLSKKQNRVHPFEVGTRFLIFANKICQTVYPCHAL